MRNYRGNAGSPVRIDFGIELAEGLKSFTETAPLVSPFEADTSALQKAYEERRAARAPLLRARARFRFAGYQMDGVIRSCGRVIEIADGNRQSTCYKEVFPNGMATEVAPHGRQQLEPAAKLVERLKNSTLPALAPIKSEWLPRLEQALAELRKASEDYAAAEEHHDSLFAKELSLRTQHRLHVVKVAGLVRATFPGDRNTQDLIFPLSGDDEPSGADGDEPNGNEG